MSSPLTNFAGIGSGFDYTSLVNSIISAASGPATAMQDKIDQANSQISAYNTYTSLVGTLQTSIESLRDGSALQASTVSLANATTAGGRSILSVDAKNADPGSYAVQVLQTASAEKLSGGSFASSSTALGVSGEFVINNKVITVASTDSLAAIRDKINAANNGSSATGVTASIISDSASSQRLVLTSQNTGSAGINLIDGAQGLAQQLGWIDATESIKHATSAGAQSDQFASSTTSIASQLGLTTASGPQTVTIGGQSVSIDLSTDSLSSIATKLSGLTGIQASVQSTTVNGATKYYLDIKNTTSFTDTNNTLAALGVLAGGRSSVAQQVQSAALTAGDATTPANASTLLSNLWNGGSASNVHAGDTLTVTGTRGDGSAVNLTVTIGASTTVQDVLDQLNNTTNGFGAGTRPAVASIDAGGHITVTDGTAGGSQLSLQVVANNQGGGRLDFGAFSTATLGRARQLVQGADAKFTVDGVPFTRSSNTVTDVVANATLSLTNADPTTTATVTIAHSLTDAQNAVQGFITAYNKVVDFIQQQNTAAPTNTTSTTTTTTSSNPPLYNDSMLRLARSSLSSTLLGSVAGAAPDMASVGNAGINFTKDGHLSLDATAFQTAFTTRFSDLQTLLSEQGKATDASVVYTSSTTATQAGTYNVQITQAATQAQVSGTGFSGTYADDGTPDTVTVTDLSNNVAAQIQLSNGMTTQQIVDAMNTAFSTQQTQMLQSSSTLYDTGNTPATTSSLLTNLRDSNGNSLNVKVGDTISYSGVGTGNNAYTGKFTVTANSTIGDFVNQVQTSIGSSATVSFANGVLSVKAVNSGRSSLSLSVTPNNEGGGQLSFGTINTTTAGRGLLSLTASVVGNQIKILQNAFGAAAGIAISFLGGGTDSTAQLGLSTGSVHGTDVAGTIGGYAATGTGRQLVGATGTPVDGLSMAYLGSTTGAAGTLSVTQGVGYTLDNIVKSWTDTVTGTITSRQTQLNQTIATQQQRLSDFNARMDVKRAGLLKQFLAMDTAVQQYKSRANSISALFASLTTTSTNSSGN